MIVKYDEFLSKIPNEITEVEVDDEFGRYITEMDKVAAKINRKETRRHVQMSELEEKGFNIPDNSNPLEDVIKKEGIEKLIAAIKKLQPQQKELLLRIYENGEKQEEISESEGVSQQAISSRLQTIYKKLKKFLK